MNSVGVDGQTLICLPVGCRLTRLGLRGNAIEDQGVTALANSLLEVGGRCYEHERSQRLSNRSSISGAPSLRRGPSMNEKTPALLTQLQDLYTLSRSCLTAIFEGTHHEIHQKIGVKWVLG